jgi:hypothetical protein|tara:strand:- start:62 stop:289 length:228 start_codon:yes stop_codon:yes gene_type:complete
MKEELIKDIFTYDPEEQGLRLDDTIRVLKEFRGKLPKDLGQVNDLHDLGYLQAILNVIDYLEVPEYVNDEAAAEA